MKEISECGRTTIQNSSIQNSINQHTRIFYKYKYKNGLRHMRVQDWLEDDAERRWDEQIERDERAGRLDSPIDRAIEDHGAERTRPL